ncbi:polysaccharide deacetylase [Paenibacillus alkaliterrae]|uniref:polysaccharide deacetylase family protein n=1 Tax=Paenibacillus alkaliterrae TaxID=320909 RepID=UPI001F2F8AF3|nr:polysaccharide deacetylase family protein [Paenibacillus alkaliterrae]MCF2940538.1 polysaccharide deacetylase [Paenibacillus alkaliterrae]
MQRVMQAAICAMVVWFGLFEPGGFAPYNGEAAIEAGSAQQAAAVVAAASSYDTKPLLAEPAVYESGKKVEHVRNKPLADEAHRKEGQEKQTPQEAGQNAERDKQAEAAIVPTPSPASDKVVYLTFDDGPSKNTERVLEILREEEIKATFFVLGDHVRQQPEIAKRIIEEGHSIGNHTLNHKYAKLYGSFAEFSEQVAKTDELIYKTTGVRTTLFRAPGGTYTNFDQGYFDAMKAAGYQVHDWNVDSGDSKRRGVPASEIIATIKGSRLVNKLVVLLHDSAGHEESVKALPAIIKYYKGKGYSFAPLTEEVEPIQFRVADKQKWTRAKVTKAEGIELARFSEAFGRSVGQVKVEPAEQTGPTKQTKSSRQTDLAEQTQLAEPKLVLHRGEERLELNPGEYGLRDGSTEVPLLKLMAWIGGSAELDLEEGVIEAQMNGKRAVWLFDTTGKPTAGQAEQAVVPIRATLQAFGIGIAGFVYNDRQREIWVAE